MSRPEGRHTAGRLAGGAAGVAATGAAFGVAWRRNRMWAKRRDQSGPVSPAPLGELGLLPKGTPCSVTADDGARLSCEVIESAGSRSAEVTVVLVHGFALDRRCWHFQRLALSQAASPRTRVVLYDHRSHGRSERTDRASCTLDQLGEDLHAVLRSLAPKGPVVLVGHSMGGMTIMALADEHPELFGDRIIGVALLSTSGGEVGSKGLTGTLLSARNPLTRGVGELARIRPRFVERVRRLIDDLIWGITRAYSYGDRRVEPWLVDLVHTMISANGVDALVDFVDTLGTHDRMAALPALARCEVLVASGDADRLIAFDHSERIAAELPEATLMRLPGVGHMAMLEQPEIIDGALAELLGKVLGRGRAGMVRRLRRRA
ncbi:MAG TPA: alpha/beta hydrolase [Pseudonocardia sp.]|nr:alpha/beta hydrolase [Pseudonocardia sp.]